MSKKFAVESGDLITVIRRVGGVFSSAGGSVNELIALFTSVRATTRESAETIATGLRTIFTRIQRVETINQLKALNIQLQDSQGQFVGAFEAVKRLSQGLAALNPKDFRFNQIVEQLGGFRQIGKVIPLIQQFDTAQRALTVAQASSGSVAKDAATAQQGLGVQIQKVREEFTALIRKFTDSGPFNTIATGALKIASAMIKVAEAVEPLLPLLTTMFGLKLGRALAPGLGQLAGIGRGSRGGGGFSKFARGGMVPGSGNRDTVPAMLTPGEFVIKKSSVKKLGSGTLAQMNKNGYATGGIVALKPYDDGPANPTSTTGKFTFGDVLSKTGLDINTAKSTILDAGKRGTITDPILKSFVKGAGKNAKLSPINKSVSVDVHGAAIGDATVGDRTEKLIRDDFRKSVNSNGGAIAGFFGASVKKKISDSDLNNLGITGVIGNAFEAILGSLGVPFDKASDVKESNESAFDFPRGVGSQIASKLKVNALASQPTDAKRTLTSKYLNEVYSKKYPNLIADEVKTLRKISIKDNIQKNEKRIQQAYLKSSSGVTQGDRDVGRILGVSQSQVAKFRKQGVITAPSTRNKGGGISGSDTVPAMLTPGEFVFNKGAAQSIGYGNLNRMNKQGVQGFADGGAVGVQHFEDGGQAQPSRFAAGIQRVDRVASAAQSFVFLGASVGAVTAQMSGLEESTKKAINQTVAFAAGFVGITATLINTITSMIGANISEVVSSEAVVKAKTTEAATSGIARGALTGFIAGIGAAVLAATYMSAKLTAEADALARGFQEALAKLKAGEGNVGQLQDTARQQIETRNRAQDFTVNPLGSRGGRGAANLAGAATGAGGGAVLGAKAGAAIGTIIAPGIGTAIGGAIGGIGGGVGGGLAGFFGLNALQGESGLSGEANANIETINRTIASLDGLYDSTKRINEVTKQINEAPGLSSDEKINRQLAAATGGASAVTEAQAANEALSALAERVGVGVQQLTKDNLTAFDDTGSALQAYEILQTQLAAATENVNAKLQITASALGEAISAQTGSTKSFEELLSDNGTFAKAFNARKEALEQSNIIEINAANQRVKNLETAQSKAVKGSQEEQKISKDLAQANKDLDAAEKAATQRIDDLRTSTSNVVEAQRQNVIELREAREAQRALNAELLKTSQATAVFKERTRLAKEEEAAIGNFIDVINNKTVKAKALGVTEIDNITDIFDFERFAKEVRSTSVKGGKAASEIGESLIANATLLQDAKDKLVKQDFENLGEGFTVADILEKELGLTANTTPGGRRVFDEIVKSLDESIKTGGNLSAQVIAEAFAPFVDVMEGQAGVLKAITESEQAELNKRSRQLDAVDALRQKELDVRKRLVDATISGLDALNKANNILAKSIDPESQAGSVSGLQVAAQRSFAQRNLDTVGLGLQAGNVDQIVKARQRALIELKNLDQNQVEARRDQERIIKATTTELERLADGSAEINAVTEAMDRNLQAIEKERMAREQVTGVIEDFVVGGVEVRRGLVEAASGVRQAFATGTLQLQTPEQRSSTVGLLDRLSDVQLAGGMTGRQIKQELVFRDAIRLGLDPELAQAIATGTSTEEKLIEANKQLTLSILVLATRMQDAALGLALPDAITAASGGMVQYRAGGGSIFKPKGTDTVPAMLSPGEFVIRKSAVDSIGADTLSAINNGVAYRKTGSKKPETYNEDLPWWQRAMGYRKKNVLDRAGVNKDPNTLGRTLDLANVPKRLGVPEGGMFDGKFIAEGLKPYGSGPSGQELMNQRAGFQAGRDAGAKPVSTGNALLDQFGQGTTGGAMLEGMPDIPSGSNFTGSGVGDAERAAAFRAKKNTQTTTAPEPQTMASLPSFGGPVALGQLRQIGDTVPSGGYTAPGTLFSDVGNFAADVLYRDASDPVPGTLLKNSKNLPSTHMDASTSTSYLTKPPNMLTGPELKQRNERIAKNKKDKEKRQRAEVDRKSEFAQRRFSSRNTERSATHHGGTGKYDYLHKPGVNKGDYKPPGILDTLTSDKEIISHPMSEEGRAKLGQAGTAIGAAGYRAGSAVASDVSDLPFYKDGQFDPTDAGGYTYSAYTLGATNLVSGLFADIPDRPEEYESERLLREYRESADSGLNARKREEEMKKEQSSLKRDQELRTFDRITDQEDFEREMAEKRAKMAELDAQIKAGGSPEYIKAREKRERNDKFRREIEEAERKRFDAQVEKLDQQTAAENEFDPFFSRLGETEEQKQARTFARIRELQNETITMPDGSTRKLTSSEISDQIAQEATQATYTDRQQAAIERSLGRFGDTDAGSDAIMKGLKFDEEGVLVDPSAPKPKPMPKVGELTHEQFLKAQQTRAKRRRSMEQARSQGELSKGISGLDKIPGPDDAIGPIKRKRRYKRGFFNRQERLDRLREEREARKAEAQELKEQRAMNAHTRGVDIQDNDTVADTYQRILRTNGPVIAKRYADSVGYKPPSRLKFTRPNNRDRQLQGSSNTDQLLQQLLRQMVNKGSGQRPQGFAAGGSAAGSDVIPAMLTPGEFVMSAGAVRQHGVGTMRSLNKGQIPRFNRGGMVGGVQYRQNGGEVTSGGVSINTANLDESFSNFVGNFSSELDKITGVFSPMAQALQDLAKVFGGSEGIKMNHVHSVTVTAGSAESKLDAQTIDQIGKLAADYVKPLLPDGNDFNVA